MIEQEVVSYILQAQKHGLTEFEIKQNLANVGWDAEIIEDSLAHAKAQSGQIVASGSSEVFHMHEPAQKPKEEVKTNFPQPAVLAVASANTTLTQPPLLTQTFPQIKKSFFKKPILWVVVVVLFLLAGGAYGYYSLVLTNPTKAWSKFSNTVKTPVYNTKFNFSYSDPGQISDSDQAGGLFSFNFKNIKLSFSGSSYVNITNPNNPESSSKIQYTFGSGDTNFSTGLEYILLNNVLYLNVGSNPFLDILGSSLNNGKKIDWLKIDLSQAKEQAGKTPNGSDVYQRISAPDFKTQVEKIWNDASIIKADKFLGIEKINGVTTAHFENSVDKQALKGVADQFVKLLTKTLTGSSSELQQKDADFANELASQLIDKLQVKEFQTWIGLFDSKLYKIHAVTNAPSFISLIKNSQNFSTGSSSDSKRLADVKQTSTALELYFNDHGGYPAAKTGVPQNLTPTYIGIIPTAPTPPSGTCTDYFNGYWYKATGTPTNSSGQSVYPSYTLTFCLGSDTGGYKAGIGEISPTGIKDNISCPTTGDNCAKKGVDSNQEIKNQAKDFINKLEFSAQISADSDYSDYGKTTQLKAPDNAFDVLEQVQSAQQKASDAKRLSDIRQLASGLELYFNDKNSYPKNLKDLTPTYIGVIPTAPAPTESICTEQDNTYTYKYSSSGKFLLTFCLGNETGGYQAGKHTLSESGIK